MIRVRVRAIRRVAPRSEVEEPMMRKKPGLQEVAA